MNERCIFNGYYKCKMFISAMMVVKCPEYKPAEPKEKEPKYTSVW